MVPAGSVERSEADLLAEMVDASRDPDGARRRFGDAALVEKVPDAGVRAGLACLAGTIAESAIDALVADDAIRSVRYGEAGHGRIAGPGTDPAERFIANRYQYEHVALLAGPLVHEILYGPAPRCDAEEKFLHGLLAMVHLQLVAGTPGLATLGTELARRINSLALSLFNSRSPGEAGFALIAPDGPGTIPGGVAGMQTPDFWSIPFLAGFPDPVPMPPSLHPVLARLGVGPRALTEPLVYDETTIRSIDEAMDTTWLTWRERGQVGEALSVL